ncbi:hypothetical protein [Azospirillum endophyticum]
MRERHAAARRKRPSCSLDSGCWVAEWWAGRPIPVGNHKLVLRAG